MSTFHPTAEQVAVLAATDTQRTLKVKAYAGAGKTSTLKLIAERHAAKRGSYLAFNRDIAADAKRKFPTNVSARTVHSLAYSSVDKALTAKLNLPKEPLHELATRYGLGRLRAPSVMGKSVELSAFHVGRMIADGVARFCRSAQAEPEAWHIPVDPKISESSADDLQAMLLPYVQRLWTEYTDPKGRSAITPDVYLKVWEQLKPQIGADFILFDEAQDSDGLMLSVLRRQAHAQVIYVGDPYQQIYEWRGAVNAMEHIKATECALTESFRFGPVFAGLASRVIGLLGETTPVRGQQQIESVLVEDAQAKPAVDAILCRKNATVVAALENGIRAGHRVAVRANIDEILAFADGADRLMQGKIAFRPTSLALFETWHDVQDYAKTAAGRDLLPIVLLINDHGTNYLRKLLTQSVPESEADYVVSTVHRAKGLEWDRVKVSGDFRFKQEDDGRITLTDEETRLLYVALTRAKKLMDVSELRRDLLHVFASHAEPASAEH